MDRSSAAGLIGAAVVTARSFQPNLLTRRTVDQAVITGPAEAIERIRACARDLASAGHITDLQLIGSEAQHIEAEVQVAAE